MFEPDSAAIRSTRTMKQQVFLVTGSSRGLGREIAQAALAAGHQVVATARRPEQLSDLVTSYGDQVRSARPSSQGHRVGDGLGTRPDVGSRG
ncbi:SDR family NAD(P)-dependent oxidoreductase [Kribbella sp. CA-253562]|uniref:SDR family NAD(P)-dependent oxidoreductase n=1 Tax=Kribbella sp. CA-253562 TaxID=3239942 RepID=UPI003D8EE365